MPPALMRKTPWARIVGSGLVAGLVINLRLVIASRYYDGGWRGLVWALRRVHGPTLATFVVPGFVEGVCLLWIYAAMAPRDGTDARTAMRSGLVAWLLADLPLFMQLFVPYRRRPIPMLAIDLVLTLLAALVGAAWYGRQGPQGPQGPQRRSHRVVGNLP